MPFKPAPRSTRPTTANAPQQVRILGGRFKRTPLPVLDWPGLRPTPSRVRETLFNWLGQDMSGWRVLDAFAGSGALGLEAASRGAESVVMLDKEAALSRHLSATVARWQVGGVQVFTADALVWMSRHAQGHQGAAFDLVMIDPPFDADLFDEALRAARSCTHPGGWIYLEAPHAVADGARPGAVPPPEGVRVLPEGLRLHRHGRAGQVHFHLIERMADAPADA